MEEEIKNIIYKYTKKAGMCDDVIDGQIIGLRTGEGLEFDTVAVEISKWHKSAIKEALEEARPEEMTVKNWNKLFSGDVLVERVAYQDFMTIGWNACIADYDKKCETLLKELGNK